MKNTAKTLTVLALTAAFSAALAQTPPPAGGAPARPEGAAGAPLGRRPIGGPQDGLRWVLQPRVRAELRLTPLQIEKIQALMPPPRPGRMGDRGPAGGPRDGRGPGNRGGGVTPPPVGGAGEAPPPAGPGTPPPAGGPPAPDQDAGRGELVADRPDGSGPSEKSLQTILLPAQFDRFRQLRLQRERLGALTRPGIADELELTASQRQKLDRMLGQPFDFEEGPGARGPEGVPPGGRPLPPSGSPPPAGGSTPPPGGPSARA